VSISAPRPMYTLSQWNEPLESQQHGLSADSRDPAERSEAALDSLDLSRWWGRDSAEPLIVQSDSALPKNPAEQVIQLRLPQQRAQAHTTRDRVWTPRPALAHGFSMQPGRTASSTRSTCPLGSLVTVRHSCGRSIASSHTIGRQVACIRWAHEWRARGYSANRRWSKTFEN
jgi:hypothetical protein